MERFLSPGFKVKPLEERESTQKVRRGRPAKQVPEGALDLGQPKVRKCGSRQNLEAEHKIASLERQVEALKLCQQAESKEERIDKMLQMLDESEEQNRALLEHVRIRNRLEGRKRYGGELSPEMLEKCRAAGREAGERGKEHGWRGGEFGILGGPHGHLGAESGELGAEFGHKGAVQGKCAGPKGGQLSPEALEKCRAAGRAGGSLGGVYGKHGGRPRKNEGLDPEAPRLAKKGVVGPEKFEPKAGHQLRALKYMREKFFTLKLGKFHDEQNLDLEHWDEPELDAVPENVWTAIRTAGFAGKVRNRDLRRLWTQRASIRQKVELLELGKAAGIYKRVVRTQGKSRRMCIGAGMRTMVVLEPVPKRRRVEHEEGGEEGGEEQEESVEELVAVRKGKQSLLKEVFEQVRSVFERWRLAFLICFCFFLDML